MPKPNTLSRTAQAVLAAAAARDDHLAVPPEHLPTAAKRAVVQSLIKGGLVEEIAADDDAAAWRTTGEGERWALRATAAGLVAVGSTVIQDHRVMVRSGVHALLLPARHREVEALQQAVVGRVAGDPLDRSGLNAA